MCPVARNVLVPVALVVAVAAAGYVVLTRSTDRATASSAAIVSPIAPATPGGSRLGAHAAKEPAARSTLEVAAAKPDRASLDEAALIASLESASDTVRNGTLVTAIRRAGFVCTDVHDATRFTAETTGWRVRCADALVYSVVPMRTGEISVEPLFDGAPPFPGIRPVDPGSRGPR